jgi:hypothetical protein
MNKTRGGLKMSLFFQKIAPIFLLREFLQHEFAPRDELWPLGVNLAPGGKLSPLGVNTLHFED